MVSGTTLFRTPEVHWPMTTGIQDKGVHWAYKAPSQTRVLKGYSSNQPIMFWQLLQIQVLLASQQSTISIIAPLFVCFLMMRWCHCWNPIISAWIVLSLVTLWDNAHHCIDVGNVRAPITVSTDTQNPPTTNIQSYVATGLKTDSLLITCHVTVKSSNGIPANRPGMAGTVPEEWLLSRWCPGKTPVPEFCVSDCYLVRPGNKDDKTKSGLCIYWRTPFKSNRVKYNSLPLEFLLDLHARLRKL